MIPNRCLFVCLRPMEFTLIAYLAVRSAAEVNDPEDVVVYCDRPPTGYWWDAAQPFITRVERVDPPTSVGGRPVAHPAHRSDLVRLDALLRDGGMYLDLDVLSVRSSAPLRDASFVLGQEGVGGANGLCNAVILAEPDAPFARAWQRGWDPATSLWDGFRSTGRDQYWAEMSVRYPAHLATLHPDLISVAAHDAFHWPTWTEEHLALLFEGRDDVFPNAYCHHLWQSYSQRYLDRLTPESITRGDTNFTRMARPFLTSAVAA